MLIANIAYNMRYSKSYVSFFSRLSENIDSLPAFKICKKFSGFAKLANRVLFLLAFSARIAIFRKTKTE